MITKIYIFFFYTFKYFCHLKKSPMFLIMGPLKSCGLSPNTQSSQTNLHLMPFYGCLTNYLQIWKYCFIFYGNLLTGALWLYAYWGLKRYIGILEAFQITCSMSQSVTICRNVNVGYILTVVIAEVHICQSSLVHLLTGKSGRLYICVVVWSVSLLLCCHGGDSSDVTLAFEDALFFL